MKRTRRHLRAGQAIRRGSGLVQDDVFDWANISAVASTVGESPSVLRRDGRSSDPMRRVRVLEDIVSHYGAHELDQDPLFSFSWGDWILKRVDFATWAFWMWGLASGDQDPLLLSHSALGRRWGDVSHYDEEP